MSLLRSIVRQRPGGPGLAGGGVLPAASSPCPGSGSPRLVATLWTALRCSPSLVACARLRSHVSAVGKKVCCQRSDATQLVLTAKEDIHNVRPLNGMNMGHSSLTSAQWAVEPTGGPAVQGMPVANPPHTTMNARSLNWSEMSPRWQHGSWLEVMSDS